MVLLILIVQVLLLVAVVLLWLRKPVAAAAAPEMDPRQAQLPEQVGLLHARHQAHDDNLRGGLTDLRRETGAAAEAAREASARDFAALRTEVTGNIARLGETLRTELASFRTDNRDAGTKLMGDVHTQHEAIAGQLRHASEAARGQGEAARDALHRRLQELDDRSKAHAEKLLATVQERLDALNRSNAAKLEEMRVIVDEKLQATLNERLTHSFGQVTTHLGEVQKGLGEMKELATGVGDLKKVLGNVKARGIVGEFVLGQQLEQMFSPEQYVKNVAVKANSSERVEYALKFPSGEGPGSSTLLPIDAKFPKEDWERLEHAYDHGTADEIAVAGRAFERAIRTEGKRICEKYIEPPLTMPHAIMFLPTEALYAEVVRRPGLQSEVQSSCRVTIAGPSTFMAILTSFQMGFHTLAIERKGDEVWRVLSSAKNEFEKYGGLMDKVRKQVDTVQNTLGDISGKTKTINRALKNVASLDTGKPVAQVLQFEDLAGVAPLLAAVAGDEE